MYNLLHHDLGIGIGNTINKSLCAVLCRRVNKVLQPISEQLVKYFELPSDHVKRLGYQHIVIKDLKTMRSILPSLVGPMHSKAVFLVVVCWLAQEVWEMLQFGRLFCCGAPESAISILWKETATLAEQNSTTAAEWAAMLPEVRAAMAEQATLHAAVRAARAERATLQLTKDALNYAAAGKEADAASET